MKKLILCLCLFFAGVVSAKFYFSVNNSVKSPYQEVMKQESVSVSEIEKDESEAEEKVRAIQSVKEKESSHSVFEPDQEAKEKIMRNRKIQSIDEKLTFLDDKIATDLEALRKIDPEFTNKLEAEINDKSKIKMEGDDEFTEKEYQ